MPGDGGDFVLDAGAVSWQKNWAWSDVEDLTRKIQLIGLREKLQENPIEIMGKSMVSGFDFPLSQPIDTVIIWVGKPPF